MSKIGRKPIAIGSANITVKDNEIHYQGKKASGVHIVPRELTIELVDKSLKLFPVKKETKNINEIWGLHRALLANKIAGAQESFEKKVKITGLGYKAILSGTKLQFTLGYSHKLDFNLPNGVTVEIDKTGQILTFKSSDRMLLGQACSVVRDLRQPEPYKGTGIQYANEVILRKAGKAKAAA